MLIELDDRRRWQDWEAKDLRPLCQRAKESAQAQGVEDDKFQRKVNALFDGMAQQPRRDTLVAKLKEWKEEVKRLRGRLQAASRRAVMAASAANGSVDSNAGGNATELLLISASRLPIRVSSCTTNRTQRQRIRLLEV